MSSISNRSSFRGVLLFALVFFSWLVALEFALRVVGIRVDGSLYVQDATRRFRLRPKASAWYVDEGQTRVTINSSGYRDRERRAGPHPGTIRIAVIGDSTVAAFMVREEETFTRVAEDLLARQFPEQHIEVLNFGIPNYNLAQQYLTLRDEIFTYQPDLVIESISLTNSILNSTRETCVNDAPYPYFVENRGKLRLYDPLERHLLGTGAETWMLNAENHSTLVLLGFKAWRTTVTVAQQWEERLHFRQPRPSDYFGRSLSVPRTKSVEQAWSVSEQTLLLMKALCKARNVPFWVLTLDVAGQVDPDLKERERYRQSLPSADLYYSDSRICRFADKHDIPCIQSAPALGRYAEESGRCLHGFPNTARNSGHLNAEGHSALGSLMANQIANFVANR